MPPDSDTATDERGTQGGDFGFDSGDTDQSEESGLDFEEAFDQAPSGDEPADFDVDTDAEGESFGFDLDQGSDEATEFEEEDFETEIPRIDLGVQGLDDMIQVGVPERSLIVAMGGAGSGKTTFALQFLHEALANGNRGVYITLEESYGRVIQSAREKGWEFGRYEDEGRLAVVDLDPVDMANSLTSIRNELPRLIEAFDASRLVLDSVSLLEMMYDDQATRRTEIYDFTRALKDAGVTTMLTSEADADNPFASRYGIIEYLTDAVFVLRHVRPEDFQETRLAIEIQKIRDANHSRETKPFEITNTGLSVYRQANIF
ncbi:circadian clock protein, KaiC [Halanaeroarchaeum sulfurireducens]|uniref:Circadian clock protein, KaiC n=1 Tax=Halanaeroarchaeum sulfurireducens TaxID=1604004 RepID=A0A0F7PFT0_9EURY|nr:circadian clock protein, KaiC [Halanaeroarchaeum sulfurireducens]ALG82798.1 circadian clock protein, KaiC [Halanaeroarchaeum sulfurireducens]